MKTAICYYSRHHGNTRKVLEAMAREGETDLIDVAARSAVRLEGYDCVGFASGIYGFEAHPAVTAFARQYLPAGKPVFFVCTGFRVLEKLAGGRGCPILGSFGCKGYDTFGPFRLVGGIAKGRPDERDLENARAFFRDIKDRLG